MVTFDAFVGVQDRHAENWGVIECTTDPAQPLRLAPLYDTARGVFVSHTEEALEKIDAAGAHWEQIIRYARNSTPIFGCPCDGDIREINHFRLVEHMVTRMGPLSAIAVRGVVNRVNLEKTSKALATQES